MNMNSCSWGNEFYPENLHFLCGNFAKVIIRNDWNNFVFKISLPGKMSSFLYSVPIEVIVQSFFSKPLLLASFFGDVMTNTYSPDTVRHLLCGIDLSLPGEGSVFWRRPFDGDVHSVR
jgi:hypothetical protein